MKNETLSPIQKELLDRADTIFKSIAEAATKAGEFAAEQIPDIAMQYITMERVYLSILVAGALIGMISILIFQYKVWGSQDFDWSIDGAIFSSVVSSVIFIPCVLVLIGNLKPLLMVWFAPKIYLITHIIQLIKT